MPKTLIAGNAKMNLNSDSLRAMLTVLRKDSEVDPPSVDVVYCPSFTLLHLAGEILVGSTIPWGAQDMSWEDSGAFTGEVSAAMLVDAGCSFVIIGHSERRTLFHESDESVRMKTQAALEAGLTPIVCVGETLEERESDRTEAVLSRQISKGLGGLAPASPDVLVVAYEPVWAIGTGMTATPEMAQAAHAHIRKGIARELGETFGGGVRILYGGSVKGENAKELLNQPDINGALVGGACLTPEAFLPIIRAGSGTY